MFPVPYSWTNHAGSAQCDKLKQLLGWQWLDQALRPSFSASKQFQGVICIVAGVILDFVCEAADQVARMMGRDRFWLCGLYLNNAHLPGPVTSDSFLLMCFYTGFLQQGLPGVNLPHRKWFFHPNLLWDSNSRFSEKSFYYCGHPLFLPQQQESQIAMLPPGGYTHLTTGGHTGFTSKSSENPRWLLEWCSDTCLMNCFTGTASMSSAENTEQLASPRIMCSSVMLIFHPQCITSTTLL